MFSCLPLLFFTGDLQSTKALLAEMKYFANIEEKVKEKLSDLAESA